ncbi:hypothetical protein LZ31DRAFT_317176 [Colletotrichum somersetense]|nr:hypothetical protein LZ31DRAFT_317176 [Colletotrichum somersetense]
MRAPPPATTTKSRIKMRRATAFKVDEQRRIRKTATTSTPVLQVSVPQRLVLPTTTSRTGGHSQPKQPCWSPCQSFFAYRSPSRQSTREPMRSGRLPSVVGVK